VSSKGSARSETGRGSVPAMRRDARERRDALIAAAAACFAEKGYTVPLEEIADRAGVGRGTLYRNFRDRASLALAVFERDIDALAARFDMERPIEEAVSDFLLSGARASALFTRMAIELPLSRENLGDFHHLAERVATIIKPLIDKAHADGALRADLSAMDIMMCMRMISGLLIPQMSEEEIREKIDRAMALLMRGLRGDSPACPG